MELTGESLIAASRARVWAALNDPAVLARCIDGVVLAATTDADGATRFDGTLDARLGPVDAVLTGGVVLTEVDAPNRYVLIGAGEGGAAGSAKGRVEVTLADATIAGRAGTRLHYVVAVSGDGELAQVDAGLRDAAARGYADTFVARLKAEVETPIESAAESAAGSPLVAGEALGAATEPADCDDTLQLHGKRRATGLTPLIWTSVVVLVVLAILVWQLR